MTEFELLINLHKDNKRQGPGSEEVTKKALQLIGKKDFRHIVDIGCGTGGQTLTLAKHLAGHITAVDLFTEFLAKLKARVIEDGLQSRITTRQASMEDLPFEAESFDLIWSEGAIYIMGFNKGINEWQKLLKPGGYIAVSELSWTTAERPSEVSQYWQKNYAEIDTISNKIKQLEKAGYSPIAHFVLTESCWLDNYYIPLQAHHEEFLKRYDHAPDAREIIELEKEEFEFYKKYKDYFSYGFYIAQKRNVK